MTDRKILVVDDEPFILRSLTYVLKKEGYQTLAATNGEEAMAVVQKTKPALVFLDVMMPKKNGFEVCSEIKNNPNLNNIHIILLTAKGQEEDRIKGMKLGADEYMTKPFSPSKIMERVRDILR